MHHSELKRVHRTTRQLKRRQSRTSTSSRLMSSYSTMSSTGRPMEREGSEPQDPPSGKREWGTRILLLIQRPGHPPWVERSRTEISIPLCCATRKSSFTLSPGLSLGPYVTSKCFGFSHTIFSFIVAYWCENVSTCVAGCESSMGFKYTVVASYAVPGPPHCWLRALASHCPSGDLASADQVIATS